MISLGFLYLLSLQCSSWKRLKAKGEGHAEEKMVRKHQTQWSPMKTWLNGINENMTQWTWIWANSGRQWRIEEPDMLQSIRSQRVRNNLETEQHQQIKWFWYLRVKSIQSVSSVTQSCLTLCNLMNCSTPGFPVFHHLSEFAQTQIHWVGDLSLK